MMLRREISPGLILQKETTPLGVLLAIFEVPTLFFLPFITTSLYFVSLFSFCFLVYCPLPSEIPPYFPPPLFLLPSSFPLLFFSTSPPPVSPRRDREGACVGYQVRQRRDREGRQRGR